MEIISVPLQTVAGNQNVVFTDTVVGGKGCATHRIGSGLVSLRGSTNCQCRARYKVFFSGNIAIPAGGTVAPIALAIAVDGEGMASTSMIQTPAAAEQFANVASGIFIDVPKGCCVQISVKNIGADPVDVQNANLIVERVA